MKKVFFQLIALVGFISFFLPWVGGEVFGRNFKNIKLSGFNIVQNGHELGFNQSFYLLIFPITFFVVILFKIIYVNKFLKKIIEFIPLLTIIYMCVIVFERYGSYLGGVDEFIFKYILRAILETVEVGILLTVIASILIIFSPLNKKEEKET